MKVYLDNGIVSTIVMDDNAPESAALYRLLAAYGDGEVDLVTPRGKSRGIKDRNHQPSNGSSGFLKRYQTLASL